MKTKKTMRIIIIFLIAIMVFFAAGFVCAQLHMRAIDNENWEITQIPLTISKKCP